MDFKGAKAFFRQNAVFLILLAVILVLSFGFTATHYAIGIDNTNSVYYFDQGGTLAQGRMTLPLIDKLVMPLDGTPFWSNALGAMLLYIAAVVWAFLLKRAANGDLSQSAMIAFSGILLSYPIMNELFIYDPWSYALSLLLCAGALRLINDGAEKISIKNILISIVLLVFMVSANESAVSVYLLGLFMMMTIRFMVNRGNEPKAKTEFKYLLKALALLIIAVVLEYLINVAVIKVFNVTAISGADNSIDWMEYGPLFALKSLAIGILYRYFLAAYWYYPITALVCAGIAAVIVAVVLAVKRKRAVILLLTLGLLLSVISLSLVKGHVTPYRTCAAFAPFIAFVAMTMLVLMKKQWMRIAVGVLIVLMILNQTRVLSDWFVNDYNRYEKDKETALHTAEDLERDFDITKPVVFAGETAMAPQVKKVAVNGKTTIGWMTSAFDTEDEMHTFMWMHGHAFSIGSEAQVKEGKTRAESQAAYPRDGYIVDYGDYIVVNFGSGYEVTLDGRERQAQDWLIDTLTGALHADRQFMEGQVSTAIKQ